MNMTDIQCFLKVAELMSFSKASEALYVTQQAVSLHIKHLEDTYHVKLFERRPALRLTCEGELLVQAAKDIIDRENALIDQFTSSQKDFYGEISIGLPPNRSTAFAGEFIPLFSGQYPNMTVRLVETTSSNLPVAVKNNQIDLALPLISFFSEHIDESMFEMVPLETEDLYVIISEKLLQSAFGQRTEEVKKTFPFGASLYDFAALPMFLHPETSHLHADIVNSYMRQGMKPFIRIKTTLTSSLLLLAAENLGIFFSNPMVLKYLYTSQPQCFEHLHVFPIVEFKATRQAILIHHKQKLLSRPLIDSIAIIRELYQEHAAIMETLVHHYTCE